MYKKLMSIILLSAFITLGLFVPAYADAVAPSVKTDTLVVVIIMGALVTVIWVVAYMAVKHFKNKKDK